MGNDWETPIPSWRKQGRTGPGPIAPKYASRKDRRTVRRGGTPGKPPPKKDCCPMVAAVRSVKHGKFRLAHRYARMSVRLILEGI